jgi:hypothetical protein
MACLRQFYWSYRVKRLPLDCGWGAPGYVKRSALEGSGGNMLYRLITTV